MFKGMACPSANFKPDPNTDSNSPQLWGRGLSRKFDPQREVSTKPGTLYLVPLIVSQNSSPSFSSAGLVGDVIALIVHKKSLLLKQPRRMMPDVKIPASCLATALSFIYQFVRSRLAPPTPLPVCFCWYTFFPRHWLESSMYLYYKAGIYSTG